MNSPQASAAAGPVNSVPGPADNTVSQAPIDTWEDAVPLDKGLLGDCSGVRQPCSDCP